MTQRDKLFEKIMTSYSVSHQEAKNALTGIGYNFAERKGSAVVFTKEGKNSIFYHIPHGKNKGKNIDKEAVNDIRSAIEEYQNDRK